MAKIAYNGCFGGFSLSAAAIKRYAELKGRDCYFFESARDKNGSLKLGQYEPISMKEAGKDIMFFAFDIPNPGEVLAKTDDWHAMSQEQRMASNSLYEKHDISNRYIPRDDPHLVQVIEEMGEKASGRCASLKIAEVPSGSRYRIDEYDGNESVMTADDYDWQVAK